MLCTASDDECTDHYVYSSFSSCSLYISQLFVYMSTAIGSPVVACQTGTFIIFYTVCCFPAIVA